MSAADPVSDLEADRLFADLAGAPALVLAVSGGPDSTALMALAARWRARLRRGPRLWAVTIDHGLRPEARREAAAVKRLARSLGIGHRTLRWSDARGASALQEQARAARYRLLADVARRLGARHFLTAHTLDDQAETVLFRMARGSGLAGLAAMQRATLFSAPESARARVAAKAKAAGDLVLVRPLLDLPKARLVATLRALGLGFAEDPSNRDPRFTRTRLRALMPQLSDEGLHPARLALLARRMRRADAAIEAVVDAAMRMPRSVWTDSVSIDAAGFCTLPGEVAMRLVGRAVARVGHEGAVELGKLEQLMGALSQALVRGERFRRTLAGAMVTLAQGRIIVEPAPARSNSVKKSARRTRGGGKAPFTKGR